MSPKMKKRSRAAEEDDSSEVEESAGSDDFLSGDESLAQRRWCEHMAHKLNIQCTALPHNQKALRDRLKQLCTKGHFLPGQLYHRLNVIADMLYLLPGSMRKHVPACLPHKHAVYSELVEVCRRHLAGEVSDKDLPQVEQYLTKMIISVRCALPNVLQHCEHNSGAATLLGHGFAAVLSIQPGGRRTASQFLEQRSVADFLYLLLKQVHDDEQEECQGLTEGQHQQLDALRQCSSLPITLLNYTLAHLQQQDGVAAKLHSMAEKLQGFSPEDSDDESPVVAQTSTTLKSSSLEILGGAGEMLQIILEIAPDYEAAGESRPDILAAHSNTVCSVVGAIGQHLAACHVVLTAVDTSKQASAPARERAVKLLQHRDVWVATCQNLIKFRTGMLAVLHCPASALHNAALRTVASTLADNRMAISSRAAAPATTEPVHVILTSTNPSKAQAISPAPSSQLCLSSAAATAQTDAALTGVPDGSKHHCRTPAEVAMLVEYAKYGRFKLEHANAALQQVSASPSIPLQHAAALPLPSSTISNPPVTRNLAKSSKGQGQHEVGAEMQAHKREGDLGLLEVLLRLSAGGKLDVQEYAFGALSNAVWFSARTLDSSDQQLICAAICGSEVCKHALAQLADSKGLHSIEAATAMTALAEWLSEAPWLLQPSPAVMHADVLQILGSMPRVCEERLAALQQLPAGCSGKDELMEHLTSLAQNLKLLNIEQQGGQDETAAMDATTAAKGPVTHNSTDHTGSMGCVSGRGGIQINMADLNATGIVKGGSFGSKAQDVQDGVQLPATEPVHRDARGSGQGPKSTGVGKAKGGKMATGKQRAATDAEGNDMTIHRKREQSGTFAGTKTLSAPSKTHTAPSLIPTQEVRNAPPAHKKRGGSEMMSTAPSIPPVPTPHQQGRSTRDPRLKSLADSTTNAASPSHKVQGESQGASVGDLPAAVGLTAQESPGGAPISKAPADEEDEAEVERQEQQAQAKLQKSQQARKRLQLGRQKLALEKELQAVEQQLTDLRNEPIYTAITNPTQAMDADEAAV